MTADLAEFLLARIAEDEAVATNRGQLAGDQWSALEPDRADDVSVGVVGRGRGVVVSALRWEAEHIARHDPARVLAECDAKRRIVEAESGRRRLHDMAGAINVQSFPGDDALVILDGKPMTVDEFDAVYTEPSPPSLTLRLLALPYADHPDYLEEWRP